LPPQNPEEHRWFTTELQPHEAMLRAWLRSQFSLQSEVDDIVQEAMVRVLRAHALGEVRAPKALLFVTARNLALMQLRRSSVVREDRLTEMELWSILDESVDVPQAVARAEELETLTKAIQSLPTRCRQIVTLRRIYGLSQKEVAAELGIAEHTVEVQSGIALRKLSDFFARHERSSHRP
jgi:RNA polymerase sigma factor (sigma-70 family)